MRLANLVPTLLLLFAGISLSFPASAELAERCDYFDDPAAKSVSAALSDLFNELPEEFAVIICETLQEFDTVSVLSPVRNRDGVSYYTSLHYQTPDGKHADDTNLVDLIDRDPIVQSTMMALDADARLNHTSIEFIEAPSISIGVFKMLHNLWTSVISTPQSESIHFDISRLNDDSKAAYSELLDVVREEGEWKIFSLAGPTDLLDAIEFSPRFVIEIFSASSQRVWSVEFDLLDANQVALLDVSELIG